VATESIWDRSELSRDEMTARIIAVGYRIDHAYALSAMTFADGRISLDNGVHLCVPRIPPTALTSRLAIPAAWP
jgi:hypothetical protein